MADIKVLIDVIGEQDMVKAINTASRMELEYKKLDRQFNKSKLTAQQYAKGIQQLDAKYDALIATTKQLTSVTKQAGAAQQVVGKGANRAGVLAQQAGYQFGDFAVQVQSGTNIMVAAGQQATQLVGTFSMLAKTTRGIMAFSALGVLIPVITGIGAAMMRTSGSSDTLLQSLDKLEETNNQLRDFGENFGEGLVGNIEAVRESFGNLVADVYELQLNQVQEKLANTFDRGLFSESFARSYTAIKPSELRTSDQLNINAQAEQELAIQEELNNIVGQTISSKAELNQLFTEAYDNLVASEVVSEDGLKRLREIAIENGVIVGHMQAVNEEADKGAKARDQQNDAHIRSQQEYLEYVRETIDSERQQVALLQAQVDYADDARGLAQRRAELEADFKKLTGESKDEFVALAMEAFELNETLAANAANANDLATALENAASAMASLSSFGDGLERTLQVSIAKVQALRAGTSDAIAGQIAGMRIDLAAQVQAARDAASVTGSDPEIDAMQAVGLMNINAIEANLAEADSLRAANRASSRGGGGGSDPFDQDAYLKSLQEEANFKNTLVGLGEAEITELERRREIVQKMTSDGQALNAADEERINKILATEAATRRAIAAEEQRQATFDMVSGHIEDAFMAMVDGSKSVEDAFKGMLRNILIEVYKQAIVKPIVGGIMGFLGFKDGGAFSGGNVIPFANGGVVSSATMFPMAGKQTGVMGEAGPEAIMPLKRGANGKLGVQVQGGGGENVVINQNFNFQANGDDSVKRIIAQAAPQIANMTKKSMLDDRRRGGQMKTTFG
ncbi:hypothetical protein OAA60_03825 [Porticoccaceae bacterium]|nr:hypothetical protein [Porticoccaceae bacterium]